MGLDTSPEQPAPVRTISRLVGEWISRLGPIWIEGQVTDFRPRAGARMQFFTLRDTDVDMSIGVVADARVMGEVTPPIEDGQRIITHVRPDYYVQRGQLRYRATEIRQVGIGALLEQLERLRKLLAAEGLFAPERKKPLPFLPRTIGLVCGRNSDAMHDVMVNARKRWPGIPFEVREVAVQGAQAVSAVTAAVSELEAMPEVDVIVITRGGGSVEDLLPFSNETLVRAVADCLTPVVSAIGHEQDAPLLDFVADVRASTPTDAARRVVPSFDEQSQLVANLAHRGRTSVVTLIDRAEQRNADALRRIRVTMRHRVERGLNEIEHVLARLRALSPAATLDRGYAIVTSGGAIVRDPAGIDDDALLDIKVAQGRLSARRTFDDGMEET